VYTIPKKMYSARRPHPEVPVTYDPNMSIVDAIKEGLEEADKVEITPQLKSDKFPQYDPVLPQFNTKFVSYDLQLIGLDSVETFSTRLESTSIVLSYGHDIYCTRITPDNRFDLLDEAFNFKLLFAGIAVLLVANFVAAYFMKQRNAKKAFLTF